MKLQLPINKPDKNIIMHTKEAFEETDFRNGYVTSMTLTNVEISR